jgi:predicted MFS family arabinose efflux permease
LGEWQFRTTVATGGRVSIPQPLPAHGLGVNVPVAAQLITAFAFTVCVTAPPLAALTARFDRRALLVAVLSFLVPSFKTLFNASPETISIPQFVVSIVVSLLADRKKTGTV